MLNFLGLIPARGGSKGIPGKNTILLAKSPLIAWTIKAAKQSPYLNRVIVSTDSEEIAQVSHQCGAEIPFLRPSELARDDTPTLPVMQHAVSHLEKETGKLVDVIVLLQPTSPLRLSTHIDQACQMIAETAADSVWSFSLARHSPFWMNRIEDGRVYPFVKDAPEYLRRQDLPPLYVQNGAIIAVTRNTLMVEHSLQGRDTRALIMDAEYSVDIDSMLDLRLAELLVEDRLCGRS